jgi:uncharacterized damage-inducible protein DinB
MARIMHDPEANERSWWDPVYPLEKLETEWKKSLKLWIDYIGKLSDDELSTEVHFFGYDGGEWAATPQDIALQLNYHSIHHRAQIQTLISAQGIKADFVDYIGTRYRKIS